YRPVDLDRDQSYFLFATTQEQLDFLRFPLGGMTKAEVRAAARELNLAIADKHDSQDICFVPQGRYSDIVQRLRPDAIAPGDIIHIDGRVLGRHNGVVNFTVGQRRGIGISIGEPLYVVCLDPVGRRVIVGPREALATRRLYLREVNWLGARPLADYGSRGRDIMARVRSTRPPAAAHLVAENTTVVVELCDDEAGVAPGQACVFYDGESAGARVLGGGFIDRTERTGAAEGLIRDIVSREPAAVRA
ncbi:MAG: MnmA/TRMU family protein, partial [Alphaproteobacteria bacterium]